MDRAHEAVNRPRGRNLAIFAQRPNQKGKIIRRPLNLQGLGLRFLEFSHDRVFAPPPLFACSGECLYRAHGIGLDMPGLNVMNPGGIRVPDLPRCQ